MASQAFSYVFFFSLHVYIVYAHHFEPINKGSTPLKFLNQLNGIQKGSTQIGIDKLKKRLSYLGYMYDCPRNFINENKNTFDKCLQLALKKYQKFYRLKITGILDENTIRTLRQPRCGMPDFYKPSKNTTSFHKHYAYPEGNPKWNKVKLTYAFKKSVKREFLPSIEFAIKLWDFKTGFKFNRATFYSSADIRISFKPPFHGNGIPFDRTGLAHTFEPPDVRMHFNKAVNWSTDLAPGRIDVQSVALHEMGHALGLAHSDVQEAVMFPGIEPGERKQLHSDDIDGVNALYGF